MDAKNNVAYTLRKHIAEVTSLKIVPREPYPILISGDSQGHIYLWNLITRRIFAEFELNSKAHVISVDFIDGYLTVLSKDHTLRFLRIEEDTSLITKTQRFRERETLKLKLVYEIPVNTLNFANVAISTIGESRYRLWCCNTTDSECIDVYSFDIKDQQSLKREFNSINLHEAVTEALNWAHNNPLEKLGIIMSFIECDGSVFLGYECGFVVGLRLLNTVDKGFQLVIAYASAVHYPEPVLSLCYNEKERTVLSSSTDGSIGIHKVPHTSQDVDIKPRRQFDNDVIYCEDFCSQGDKKQLATTQIGHLECIDTALVAANWHGETLVFEDYQTRHVFSKQRSNVLVEDTNVGTFSEQKSPKTWIKPCSIACLSKQVSTSLAGIQLGDKRRIDYCSKFNWCFTGYEDGSIIMQNFSL